MEFYFAASYPRQKEMREYAEALVATGRGHTCNSRWVFEEHAIEDMSALDGETQALMHRYALDNAEDLVQSDVVVFFSSTEKIAGEGTVQHPPGRGGRHTEIGMALALLKPIYFIGERENIFHAFVPKWRMFYSFRDLIVGIEFIAADYAAHSEDWPRNLAYEQHTALLLGQIKL